MKGGESNEIKLEEMKTRLAKDIENKKIKRSVK